MTATTRSVFAAGYVTLDVILHSGTVSHCAGGTAANVAANLAFFGWTSSLTTRIGRDAPARRVLYNLRSARVGVEQVERDGAAETPVVLYHVDPPVHWFTFKCPTCQRRLPRHRPITAGHLERLLAEALAVPDVFFFDRPSGPALRLAEHFRARGSTVMFEPSVPAQPDRTLSAAALADIIKCSRQRRGRLPSDLLDPRPRQLQIETAGAKGLRYRLGKAGWKTLAAAAAIVQDSGGAGDWLTAALLHCLPAHALQRRQLKAIEDALVRAQAVAAVSCGMIGAQSLATLPREVVLGGVNGQAHELRPPGLRPTARLSRSRATGVCPICLVER